MRPIDAEALRHDIHTSYSDDLEILEHIDNAPTLDVKPIVHAHWIEKNDWIACSNCNHEILDDYYEKRYKYIACPYCSAEMDKAAETKRQQLSDTNHCSIEFSNNEMVIHTNCLHCGSKMNIAIDKKVADDFYSTFEVMKCEDIKAQEKI